MRTLDRLLVLSVLPVLVVLAWPWPACATGEISVPEGVALEIFARVPGARSMAVAGDVLYVGTRGNSVYAVKPDGRVARVLQGLRVPNGVAWKDGYLYVAEQHRLVRFAAPDPDALARSEAEVLFDGLPDKEHHGWRVIAFAPDGALFMAVGAPCNVCWPEGLEGAILRFDPQTWSPEVYARGVRNSVGLAFQPGSGALVFTDNGADGMGGDLPPDELNRASGPGQHFGYPWFGGGGAHTPQLKNQSLPSGLVPPLVEFGAHVAALGVHFYQGNLFPEYEGDAFVAQHGSWNRTVPDGYRVVRIPFGTDGEPRPPKVFAEGWLGRWGAVSGRPVDIAELKDGSLLISDDHAGIIYRCVIAPRPIPAEPEAPAEPGEPDD